METRYAACDRSAKLEKKKEGNTVDNTVMETENNQE